MSDTVLKRMQQIEIEARYSRKNVRAAILADITDSSTNALARPIELAEELLIEYFQKQYYLSKNERLGLLTEWLYEKEISVEEIVIEVLIIVMPMTSRQPLQGAVGQLANMFACLETFDAVKTAAEILGVICHADIYDIIPARDAETGSMMIRSKYSLELNTLQFIANTQYLPPIICEPNEITNNNCSPYLAQNDSVILGRANHHMENQALDVLNLMSSTKLSLDLEMLAIEEESSKPLDTIEKMNNFNRMKVASRAVYNEMLKHGNVFHIGGKYDKRGRLYSQGYHINIQSTEYKKSIISLHKKEVIEC